MGKKKPYQMSLHLKFWVPVEQMGEIIGDKQMKLQEAFLVARLKGKFGVVKMPKSVKATEYLCPFCKDQATRETIGGCLKLIELKPVYSKRSFKPTREREKRKGNFYKFRCTNFKCRAIFSGYVMKPGY